MDCRSTDLSGKEFGDSQPQSQPVILVLHEDISDEEGVRLFNEY